MLVAVKTASLSSALHALLVDDLAAVATSAALAHLQDLFAARPDALGAMMAGRAEEIFGNAATVSAATSALAADLLTAVGRR